MKNKFLIIALCVVAAIIIVVTTVLIVTWDNDTNTAKSTPDQTVSQKATPDQPTDAKGQTPDQIVQSTQTPTQDPTQAPTTTAQVQTEITAPDSLVNELAKNSNTVDDLTKLSCKQLVIVSSTGATANINFYVLQDNAWVLDSTMSCSGYIGGNGITTDMHEFSYATPKGLYSVGDAFYINSAPQTGLSSFKVTNDTYWVDDPDSKYYNKRVEGTSDKDWDSAEHMIDYATEYEYGFVINYNLEAKYNAGSAIFFHVGHKSTAGCVATSKDSVLAYLRKLDANQSPYILMV